MSVIVILGLFFVFVWLKEKENNGLEGKYTFRAIDATKKETLKGICDGVDIVITTMGLTTSSTKFTAYDIDYQGNLNLLPRKTTAHQEVPNPPRS